MGRETPNPPIKEEGPRNHSEPQSPIGQVGPAEKERPHEWESIPGYVDQSVLALGPPDMRVLRPPGLLDLGALKPPDWGPLDLGALGPPDWGALGPSDLLQGIRCLDWRTLEVMEGKE